MRKFDDLEPDEMPEVLRAAVRDREEEHERDLERAAIQEAATEMGLTSEHLDRAAAQMQACRVDAVRRRGPIRVAAVILGGFSLGVGLGRMLERPEVLGAVCSVLGVILVWWAISDWRKSRPGTPGSEADGSHTIE